MVGLTVGLWFRNSCSCFKVFLLHFRIAFKSRYRSVAVMSDYTACHTDSLDVTPVMC